MNIGTGEDISIDELAGMIKTIVAYKGEIKYNDTYPDGTKQKLLDVSAVSGLGWNARIGLQEGIAATYQWYLAHHQ